MTRFDDPKADERFYAHALSILVGPSRRVAVILRFCNVAYWLSVMVALAWIAAQTLDRRVPVLVTGVEVLTPSVVAGGALRARYRVMRLRTCETDISWSIFDGAREIRRFGPLHIDAPGLPGPDSFVKSWPVPADAAPGEARLRVVLAFQCPGNYLHALYPVVAVLPDLPFTIETRRGAQNVGVPAGVGTSTGLMPGVNGGSLQPGGSTTSGSGEGTPSGPRG